MSREQKKEQRAPESSAAAARLRLAAIGIEAEFALLVDGEAVRPEDVFGDPRGFIRQQLVHRVGTSYHLPTGGAVYFDTGVIELATPIIEIERRCAERAGRSLWEGILFVRDELDAWERRTGREARLAGFSTHYNISFDDGVPERREGRSVEKLALLLCYILPLPVMLLAANRRSTGIGVRPRGDRIEVTADFTPSPGLMIATAALITGIVREVMRWPDFELERLETEPEIPVLASFHPVPHTSRQGWLARYSCFPDNPFAADINRRGWRTTAGRTVSLRRGARAITRHFWPSIRRVADPITLRLIAAVMRGSSPSLLELRDRPAEYEDVGRLCRWEDPFPDRALGRSRYERVMMRAISGRPLRIDGGWHTPVGMEGWSRVVFRRDADGVRRIFPIDLLLERLRDWR
jgi:hypothetical protein